MLLFLDDCANHEGGAVERAHAALSTTTQGAAALDPGLGCAGWTAGRLPVSYRALNGAARRSSGLGQRRRGGTRRARKTTRRGLATSPPVAWLLPPAPWTAGGTAGFLGRARAVDGRGDHAGTGTHATAMQHAAPSPPGRRGALTLTWGSSSSGPPAVSPRKHALSGRHRSSICHTSPSPLQEGRTHSGAGRGRQPATAATRPTLCRPHAPTPRATVAWKQNVEAERKQAGSVCGTVCGCVWCASASTTLVNACPRRVSKWPARNKLGGFGAWWGERRAAAVTTPCLFVHVRAALVTRARLQDRTAVGHYCR